MNKNRSTDRKINRKSGFTLIELIVVVTVLAILAAVAVPMISSYTGKASSAVCLENRNMLLRTYEIHKVSYPNDDFDTFFQLDYSEKDLCPSGGEYAYADGTLTCSYHGDDGSEDGDDTGVSGPSGIVELPEGHSFPASASWDEVMDVFSGSISQILGPSGFVFYDNQGYYIWKNDTHIDVNTQFQGNEAAVKIITDKLIQPDDWSSTVYVEPGIVRYHTDGEYYVWINSYSGEAYPWVASIGSEWRKVRNDWAY